MQFEMSPASPRIHAQEPQYRMGLLFCLMLRVLKSTELTRQTKSLQLSRLLLQQQQFSLSWVPPKMRWTRLGSSQLFSNCCAHRCTDNRGCVALTISYWLILRFSVCPSGRTRANITHAPAPWLRCLAKPFISVGNIYRPITLSRRRQASFAVSSRVSQFGLNPNRHAHPASWPSCAIRLSVCTALSTAVLLFLDQSNTKWSSPKERFARKRWENLVCQKVRLQTFRTPTIKISYLYLDMLEINWYSSPEKLLFETRSKDDWIRIT